MGRQKWQHFYTVANGNQLTCADEQEARRYETDRVCSVAAEAEEMSLRVGSAGRVGRLGGPGQRAWLAESAGLDSLAGLVCWLG